MSPTGPSPHWRLAVHPELASTADVVARAAAEGEAEGLAVLAVSQTAGRGRIGRQWHSPPGNLYLSALLRPATPPREAAQWSLLAGVALAEASAAILPDPEALRLKWPNDLLYRGAKCAGILAETSLAPDGRLAWLSLGFGVNLAHAPLLPDRPTAHFGAVETPEPFARRLLDRLGEWGAEVRRGGFSRVREAWVARSWTPGEPLTVRLPGGLIAGRFAGLAEDGALLLQTSDTTRRVTTGEIDGTG